MWQVLKKRILKAKKEVNYFIDNFINVLRRPEMVILPGNLAFSFVLAIIPLFSLISYGASILNLSVDYLYNFLAHSFSTDIADIILGVSFDNATGISFFLTVLIGFYVASNGADSIITASNAIYGFDNSSWLKRRIKAIGMSILIVILLVFMLIVPVFGNTIINLVQEVNLNALVQQRIIMIFKLLIGPISWLIMFAIIKIIYKIAPSKKPKNRSINYGALFTTVGWIIGTEVYSLYITYYANYSYLYGSLASIVVLMIWIYALSFIFTVGIALNSQKDQDNLLKTGTIKK